MIVIVQLETVITNRNPK